jgi:hypothetical protein
MGGGRLDGADALLLVVFEDLEVFGGEAVDWFARSVGDDYVEYDEAGVDGECGFRWDGRGLFGGRGLGVEREWRCGEGQDQRGCECRGVLTDRERQQQVLPLFRECKTDVVTRKVLRFVSKSVLTTYDLDVLHSK